MTKVIDSHTGGEPTRVVIEGGPDLGSGSIADRLARFRDEHDDFRRALINEPRGSEILVGAQLIEPDDASCLTGVIFFNNVGTLRMCGHGTIGLVVTLAHLGRLTPGTHRIDTVEGPVTVDYRGGSLVTFQNVPSYRHANDVAIEVEGLGTVTGDIAYGGNWFFLVDDHTETIDAANIDRLTEVAWKIRHALERDGITGADGDHIDHIELFGPPSDPGRADGRNFVLCPGGAYDRSPCGTGTSAKLACLIADGKVAPGETWRQESVIGSVFEARGDVVDRKVIPTLTGEAFITGETSFVFDPKDPFRHGIDLKEGNPDKSGSFPKPGQ